MSSSVRRVLSALCLTAVAGGAFGLLGPAATASATPGSQHRVFASPSTCRNLLFADAQRLRDAGHKVVVSQCRNRGGEFRTRGYLKWL